MKLRGHMWLCLLFLLQLAALRSIRVEALKAGAVAIPGNIDGSQDACVVCQFIVERCQTNVLMAGMAPFSMPAPYGFFPPIFVEDSATASTESTSTTSTSASTSADEAEGENFALTDAPNIAGGASATNARRAFEAARHDAIYGIVDQTLDQVCESAIPSSYYGFCKQIYQTQTDVVDGLRRNFNPQDICFRVGMCKQDSYIAQGVHSRYKNIVKDEPKPKAKGK